MEARRETTIRNKIKDKMIERHKVKIKDKTTIVFVQIYFQGPVI